MFESTCLSAAAIEASIFKTPRFTQVFKVRYNFKRSAWHPERLPNLLDKRDGTIA